MLKQVYFSLSESGLVIGFWDDSIVSDAVYEIAKQSNFKILTYKRSASRDMLFTIADPALLPKALEELNQFFTSLENHAVADLETPTGAEPVIRPWDVKSYKEKFQYSYNSIQKVSSTKIHDTEIRFQFANSFFAQYFLSSIKEVAQNLSLSLKNSQLIIRGQPNETQVEILANFFKLLNRHGYSKENTTWHDLWFHSNSCLPLLKRVELAEQLDEVEQAKSIRFEMHCYEISEQLKPSLAVLKQRLASYPENNDFLYPAGYLADLLVCNYEGFSSFATILLSQPKHLNTWKQIMAMIRDNTGKIVLDPQILPLSEWIAEYFLRMDESLLRIQKGKIELSTKITPELLIHFAEQMTAVSLAFDAHMMQVMPQLKQVIRQSMQPSLREYTLFKQVLWNSRQDSPNFRGNMIDVLV